MSNMPQVSINTDMSEGLCFGCGRNNPIGLKLSFRQVGKTIRAEFTPDKLYQGWPGVVHGGIITCILDEAMSYAIHFKGLNCLTAKMQIRFKRPAPLDEPLVITSSVIRKAKNLIETKASICLRDGTLLSEGTGTHFIVEAQTNTSSQEEKHQK